MQGRGGHQVTAKSHHPPMSDDEDVARPCCEQSCPANHCFSKVEMARGFPSLGSGLAERVLDDSEALIQTKGIGFELLYLPDSASQPQTTGGLYA